MYGVCGGVSSSFLMLQVVGTFHPINLLDKAIVFVILFFCESFFLIHENSTNNCPLLKIPTSCVITLQETEMSRTDDWSTSVTI